MRRIVLSYVRIIDTISTWTEKIGCFLILPMIGVVFYEVISRRFFHTPTIWAMDVLTMLFGVYIIWSGAPSVLAKAQVCMDAISGRWRPRTRACVDAVTFTLSLSFCFLLAWETTKYAIESWQVREISNSILAHPLYHWRTVLAVGTWLLFLQLISEIIKNAWLAATGEELK